jgi:hypothetical protein
MFVIGKANDTEVAEMRKMGFEVEEVDTLHFDLALEPDLDVNATNEDRYDNTPDNDRLVCIFLDYDIVQECRDIFEKEVEAGLKTRN